MIRLGTLTQAALLAAEVGFDAFYFARIDYQDRIVRREQGRMEMLWRASTSLKPKYFQEPLFKVPTVLLRHSNGGYGGGSGAPSQQFPVMADRMMENSNVKSYVDYFVEAAREYQTYSQGKNVLMMMGCDYKYENAFQWYKNLDLLIDAVNKDGRVNAVYSDPETYTNAKNLENLTWSIKTDDFIPCAQDWSEESGLRGHMYWTGYFTSRPTLKYYQRVSSSFLTISTTTASVCKVAN